MTKHTDRYDNQNIIDLAKKDYESKQKNNIPSEIVTLTSRGNVYPKDHPLRSGKIEMRYMTAYDEDILTNSSYIKEGVVLDRLIQELIVSDIKFSELAQVDKDGLLINSRILSYGAEYPVLVPDPKTGKPLERVVDLSKLSTKTMDIACDDLGEFTYSTNDLNIKFKFAKVADNTIDLPISKLLSLLITEINGSRKQSDIDHFIQYEFLVKDSKKFQNHINDITPEILLEYEFEGEDGSTFTSGFPINRNFFWV